VERKIDGRLAAVTWWVDDVLVDEGDRRKKELQAPSPLLYSQQLSAMRLFDELIHNTDRNLGNIIWSKDWRLWLIDHTRAFRVDDRLRSPDDLRRVDRALFDRLRALNQETVANALGKFVSRNEIKALLSRRDKIVALVNRHVTERGEAAVFYTAGASR
jgi:hypothetical protein